MQPSVLLLLVGVAAAAAIPDAYKYVGVGYQLLGVTLMVIQQEAVETRESFRPEVS